MIFFYSLEFFIVAVSVKISEGEHKNMDYMKFGLYFEGIVSIFLGLVFAIFGFLESKTYKTYLVLFYNK